MLKPYYPHKPIASIEALAITLGIHPKLLIDISKKIDSSYTSFLLPPKPNKKPRTVHEPKYELKKLQKHINARIFEAVEFPDYLQGGIKDKERPRDYVENAIRHAHANQIICLDITSFYPNIKYEYVVNIFQYFFKFSPVVSEILAKITTYHGKVPQGGCTSSYIANLVFYDTEYSLVSEFQKKGIKYSRLLDDITLSTYKTFTKEQETLYITTVAAMFKKYSLRINNKKTKIEHRSNPDPKVKFEVTGLWIGHKKPKARKKERRFIRQLVFICENEYKISPHSDSYHKRWNEVSGKVAKLQRLGHIQAESFRQRLSLILPLYDNSMKIKITLETKKMIKVPAPQNQRINHIKRVNKLINKIGILARNNKSLAKSLRLQLNGVYAGHPTAQEIWVK